VARRVLSAFFGHRFTILLATLLAVMLVAPVVLEVAEAAAPDAGSVVYLVVSVCLLLAAVLAVSGRRAALQFGLGLALPVLVLDLAAVFLLPGQLPLVRHGTRALFLGFVSAVLLRHLFRQRRITFDTINASLCVYLLGGVLWANLFAMMETVTPGSFVDTGVRSEVPAKEPSDAARSFRLLYFSFATLSSLGYGDIVPRTTLARMCAVTEAMTGQAYLLVMVSRLVGIQVSQGQEPPA
jgi:hypothetical protein